MHKILRKNVKRIIAYLLIFSIVFSTMPTVFVEATDNIGSYVVSKEASLPINSYWPDWYTAILVDRFSWNAFHNAVQNDIRE